MKPTLVFSILTTLFLLPCCTPSSQLEKPKSEDLIAASQTGAKPLFFDPGDPGTQTILPDSFKDEQECIVRSGLPNFFYKAKAGKPMLIGYIGGSITRGNDMYRNQSAKFIQQMYPDVKMKAINAGVSGTGTDLGACRIENQLLQFKPDLIFIEFAVNGAFMPGMEGMIRQIWKFDPKIDICLVYTIQGEQWQEYANGRVPKNIQGLEEIASHYQVPAIHMALEASHLVADGKLRWKAGKKEDRSWPDCTKDGIHPTKVGGDLYAEAIARGMMKMSNRPIAPMPHSLPAPLLADNWEDAKMLGPKESGIFNGEWKTINPLKSSSFRQYAPWFPYIMESGTPGASFSFQFTGNMVGLFDIGGPEAGQLSLSVDGQRIGLERKKNSLVWKATDTSGSIDLLNRFNKYCNNRYRGQCEFIELVPGLHRVTFSISPQKADKSKILGKGHQEDIDKNPGKYNQTKEWLGKILIRGNMVAVAK